ncbi:hypothetical protein G3I76_15305, partial [Streptomyces sp. SID11233]|nr:hypothetical protein [Streptomyces sp. SID11233]
WVQSTAGGFACPTVHGERLYTVSIDAKGSEFHQRSWLYAASARTGTEAWTKESELTRTVATVADDSLYTGV